MPSGLYIAASGMDSALVRQNVIANNMANISTVGFKKNQAVDEAFPTYLIARLHDQKMNMLDGKTEVWPNIGVAGGGVVPQEVATDYSQGAELQTNNPLDFTLRGPGFFSVLNPDGKTFLTRDGSFSLDANGRLVNKDGLPVLGHNGEIYITGNQVTADQSGNINVDGKALDQLLIVKVQNQDQLTKVGHSLFQVAPGNQVDQAPDGIQVRQGFLEQSNVNSMMEMVNMIDNYRSYDLNSRIISTYDHLMDQAASQIGTLKV